MTGADKSQRPAAKQIACANCGASIPIFSLSGVQSVGCGSCGATTGVNEDLTTLLAQYKDNLVRTLNTKLQIGAKGKLNGVTYQVRGMIHRKTSDGEYSWDEYFLFSPSVGTVWLAESQNNWVLFERCPGIPAPQGVGQFKWHDIEFECYSITNAIVDYAVGEFYWEIRPGDPSKMVDYLGEPYMLSCETIDNDEINWLVGTYVPIAEMRKAFNDKLVYPYAAHALKPPFYGPFYGWLRDISLFFIMAIFVIQIALMFVNRSRTLTSFDISRDPSKEEIVSQPFKIPDSSNIELTYSADIDNDWMEIEGDLVKVDTGESLDASSTIEYYHGYDGGESWSEGSRINSINYHGVPAGSYVLSTASNGAKNIQGFRVTVQNNVISWFNFFLAIFPFCGTLFIAIIAKSHDRQVRWADSDKGG